jgi:peptidoglycan/xylan/chitin deacetylase (PgdA/CDA1 family)
VRRLVAAGWELGAHTFTHPDLRSLDDAALEHEVAGSRREIRCRFGVPVDSSAIPPAGTAAG